MADDAYADLFKVEEIVLGTCDEFAKLGLLYLSKRIIPSKLAGESILFSFGNPKNNIGVDINVFPGRSESDRGFVAMITRTGNETLNILDYLRLHGHKESEEVGRLFFGPAVYPDIEPFVRQALDRLIRLLSTEFQHVLDGSQWESIPVDWRGYK